MKTAAASILVLFSCLVLAFASPGPDVQPRSAGSWDQAAAAKYLDSRESFWLSWSESKRDHGTACVSCHTALPYALSRRALRSSLKETSPSPVERAMLDNVTKRVRLWSEVEPFYSTEKVGPRKTPESRGTEAILNALILANYDAEQGNLSKLTRSAFDNVWALQLQSGNEKGAWDWLNFHNGPWEADGSQYMGAALAAVAVGIAPDNYRAEPAIQPNLKLLSEYLSEQYESQSVLNRTIVLWASAKLPDLLSAERRSALETEIYKLQREDGGWNIASLGSWQKQDKSPVETKSDGYATGLVIFALEQAGVPRSQARVEKGLAWLDHNQDPNEGLWRSYSVNKQRDPNSNVGHFMSDAATAYAVMALKNSL